MEYKMSEDKKNDHSLLWFSVLTVVVTVVLVFMFWLFKK